MATSNVLLLLVHTPTCRQQAMMASSAGVMMLMTNALPCKSHVIEVCPSLGILHQPDVGDHKISNRSNILGLCEGAH